VDHDSWRRRDHDQIFVSGKYHLLHDYDKDQSLDLGAALTLTWDFRDLAYEPDQIELSRESRLVIGLRDDVLDEINQLYFERLAIQTDLSAQRSGFERGRDPTDESPQDPSSAAPREAMLKLRLRELTAGLDAWTGGWFSEQLAPAEIEGM
jgi:hypothetical protein